MATLDERRTEEGFRRLIAFTDAVVAIALTLLVLPLADFAGDIERGTHLWTVFADHDVELLSFAISFVVIWMLWRQHHRSMEYFRFYDSGLMNLTFLWLFTIVVLPFATALLDGKDIDWANDLYIGVLLVSVTALTALERWGVAHPQLLNDPDDPGTREWMTSRGRYATMILFAGALIIAIVVPSSGSWPLLLLVLSGPVGWLLTRGQTDDEAPAPQV
ncbi:TMEM175 family protein [Gordonia sp. NPDC003376]